MIGTETAINRWGFGIKGGLSTGILTQLSGKYVAHNSFNTNLFDVAQNKSTFKTLLVNAVITPQISYYINERSNVFIAPSMQRNLQSITKAGSELQQRYNIWGFRFGIRSRLR